MYFFINFFFNFVVSLILMIGILIFIKDRKPIIISQKIGSAYMVKYSRCTNLELCM